MTIEQADKRHPLVFIVLKSHHITVQHLWPHFHHLGMARLYVQLIIHPLHQFTMQLGEIYILAFKTLPESRKGMVHFLQQLSRSLFE